MDFFSPARNESERYNNALLNEIRRGNELLERIAQLLQPKVEVELKQASGMQTKRNYTRRKQNAK